jgi:uncharacterized protein with HEPN domain
MSHRNDEATLLDIYEAGRRIAAFIEGMQADDFRRDQKTQAAVQHQIMVIGEAAKHLSAEFREAHAGVPWNMIARMRDRLIHGYSTVDINVVWDTALEGIPQLLRALEPLVPGQ